MSLDWHLNTQHQTGVLNFRYEIDIRPYSPGPLSEIRIDNCKVKVGATAPGLWVHLLDQPCQLLQGGVHPGVDLQLVLRCLTYGKELLLHHCGTMSSLDLGSSSISTPIQGSARALSRDVRPLFRILLRALSVGLIKPVKILHWGA